MKQFNIVLMLFVCIGISNIACIINAPGSSDPPPKVKKEAPSPEACLQGETKVTIDGSARCAPTCNQTSPCSDTLSCQQVNGRSVCLPTTCPEGTLTFRDQETVQCLDYCDEETPCQAGHSCQWLNKAYKLCIPDTTPASMDPCASNMSSARCQAEVASFDQWQPVSVLTNLEITSNIKLDNQIDLDNNQLADNALGDALGLSSALLQETNNSLLDASPAFVWEHQGIDLKAGGAYTINFYRGTSSGGPAHAIFDQSIASGVQSKQSAQATLRDGQITATAPSLTLEGKLLGITIPWRLHHVSIEAQVDQTQDPQLGLSLTQGKISGVIYRKELIDAYNDFFQQNCDCVRKSGDIVASPVLRRDAENITNYTCRENLSHSTCNTSNAIDQQCISFVDFTCDTVELFSRLTMDVADDGQTLSLCDKQTLPCQAISISLTFDAFKGRLTHE